MPTLDEFFASMFDRLGIPPPVTLRDELLKRYTATDRYYHNDKHLLHCLQELSEFPQPNQLPVELALWFHDAVYDPHASHNEEHSAELAADRLGAVAVPPDLIADVCRLIRITTHIDPPTADDEKLITDIDLAILGQPPDIFDAYERAIRQEYAHVPDDQFRSGRARFLYLSFFTRPAIYATPFFHNKYESQARQNLTRSLNTLTRRKS